MRQGVSATQAYLIVCALLLWGGPPTFKKESPVIPLQSCLAETISPAETVEWPPLLNASPQRGPRECPCNPYCCRTGPVLWGYRCVGGIYSYCEGGYSRDWGCVPTTCGCVEPCGCEECVLKQEDVMRARTILVASLVLGLGILLGASDRDQAVSSDERVQTPRAMIGVIGNMVFLVQRVEPGSPA